jgi:hypothetical protein
MAVLVVDALEESMSTSANTITWSYSPVRWRLAVVIRQVRRDLVGEVAAVAQASQRIGLARFFQSGVGRMQSRACGFDLRSSATRWRACAATGSDSRRTPASPAACAAAMRNNHVSWNSRLDAEVEQVPVCGLHTPALFAPITSNV